MPTQSTQTVAQKANEIIITEPRFTAYEHGGEGWNSTFDRLASYLPELASSLTTN